MKKITAVDFIKIGLAVIVACITFNTVVTFLCLDNEASWMFAINHLYLTNELGTAVFFDFGPLGFLLWPAPLGINVLISALTWLALRFVLALTLVELIATKKIKQGIGQTIFAACCGIIFFAFIPAIYNYLIIFFTIINLLLLFNNGCTQKRYLYYAAIFATINFLLQPGYSLASYAAIFSYFVIYSYKNKSIKLLCGEVLVLVCCYFGLWLLITQGLSGSIQFVITNYSWVTQFASTASLNPPNNWLYVIMMLLLFGCYFVIFYKKDLLDENGPIIPLVLLLPLFLAFKYAFSREDIHLYFLLYFLILSSLYLLIFAATFKKIIATAIISSLIIGLCIANQSYAGFYTYSPPLYVKGMSVIYRQLIHYREFNNYLNKQSQIDLQVGQLQLPPIIRSHIKTDTVDIYPDNLILVPANNLHWLPRPCVEAMGTYDDRLDLINAQHFNDNARAPNFIVWTPEILATGYFKVDNKVLLSAEPATIYQILNWYKMVAFNSPFVLFKRQVTAQLSPPINIKTEVVVWNSWINTPNIDSGILRAHIFAETTIFGKIKILLYKQDNVWIDYKLKDGSIRSHHMVLATAKNGAWISPYLEKINALINAKPNVVAIRLRHTASDFFTNTLTIIWDMVLPRGVQ